MKYITTKEFAALSPIHLTHKEQDKTPVTQSALEHRHILFQKKIVLDTSEGCTLKITADDYYKLYINQRLAAMGPAASYYNHRNYNEMDVSEYLAAGENLITVHVYYQGLLNRAYDSADNRCALGLELSQNGKLICEADESWHYHYDQHYIPGEKMGYETQFLEHLDFTWYQQELYDGSCPGEPACVIDADYVLEGEPARLIELERITPEEIRVLSDQEIFVDFGREYVGYPCFSMKGKKGQKVTVLCGEETEPGNEFRARAELRCNCNYREVLTMSGDVDQVDFYEYKAFRYMTLEGEDVIRAIDPASVTLLARHAAYENKGARLVSGEPLLRDIWNLCEHTIHYTVEEGFLDCPTREKGQYLGDFTVSGLAQLYLSGDPYMYRKTLLDFARSAEVCPGLLAVYPGAWMQEIADFSLQYPLQVLNYYQYTGDRETAIELLPVIRGLLNHFRQYEQEDGLLKGVTDKWNIVDWPANLRDGYDFELSIPIAEDAFHNVVNAFYVGANKCAEELADLLGEKWDRRSDRLAEAFHNAFYNEALGLYTDSPVTSHAALHSNVIPAFFGFAARESHAGIRALIAEKKFSCGVQFSYFVLGACAAMGAYDLEYALITDRSEHSWHQMLSEGATTLFEAWGKDQKWNTSLCHPWAAAPIPALCHDAEKMREQGVDVSVTWGIGG